MEVLTKKLIDMGWEFSIRYENGEYSISVWKPDWPSKLYTAPICPTGKGVSWDVAALELMEILRMEAR